MRHPLFIARTVLVKNNNIDDGMKLLNRLVVLIFFNNNLLFDFFFFRILGKEGLFEQYRRTRYFEKPFQVNFIITIEIFKCIIPL